MKIDSEKLSVSFFLRIIGLSIKQISPFSVFFRMGVCFCLLPAFVCTNSGNILTPLYIPPIVFHGFIGKEEVTYRGNFLYPNKISYKGDTLILECVSDNYSTGTFFTGDRLWIHIAANDTDSTYTNGDVSLHFSRYYESGQNSTYDVFFSDTLGQSHIGLEMQPLSNGGTLHIKNINAKPRATQSSPLEITIEKGEIW